MTLGSKYCMNCSDASCKYHPAHAGHRWFGGYDPGSVAGCFFGDICTLFRGESSSCEEPTHEIP